LKLFNVSIYEYSKNHFPPAYLADEKGRATHSWRVLLLELDDPPLYEQYRFSEPWNGPHNKMIAEGLPIGMSGVYPMYHCASDDHSDRFDTSYVMVVGPDTVSSGANARTKEECTDGTSCTIALGEMSESGIPWMEPRDLKFEEMSFRLNDPHGRGLRSRHPAGVNALFLDGTVRTLHEDIDPELLKSLFQFSDGKDCRAIWDD
jgi:prepilin-type processing-associated H-X9-DG protein